MSENSPTVPVRDLVSKVVGGGTPSRSVASNWLGHIPWASVKDLSQTELELTDTQENISPAALRASASSLIPAGTPVIATRMAVGRTAMPMVDIAINQDLKALFPARGVDGRYLLYALRSLRTDLDAVATGSTVRGIQVGQMLSFRLPAHPIEEQLRIVETLDAMELRIHASQRLAAKWGLLRLGLLNHLIPDPVSIAQDPPPGWTVAPVSSWCDRMTVGVVNSATHAYVDGGVPFIRSQNVRPDRIDQDGMLFVTDAYNRTQTSSILRSGDIVVVRTGYPGTAAVVPRDLDGANCFSLLVATPRRAVIRPEYLTLFLNSDSCKAQIGRMQFGSAQHNLNLAELKRLPVPVPTLKEQDRIVEVARAAEQAITEEARQIDKLGRLRDGVSSDLFTRCSRLEVRAS